ncbi:unnamed protein product [Blepharisma stoltei]|uniref:EGF-like domain-containing protein n=1 Tax=Blepharisma stoltei TaxID=1481888 RepID=A0AAU9KG23_9CILI|nr:unnamed protein product [Blepharisma stoltei]
MLKGTVIWACVLTILSFTAASSKFNAWDLTSDSQFVLKSLAEIRQQAHLYKPLRIHIQMIEESFNNDETNKNLQSALATSAKLMSDLLLIKPTTGKLRLSENNQCTDILLSQVIQSKDLSADITIFAANNEEKGEIASSKKCEVYENKTIRSLALEINAEKFMKLDELSQAKELCIAISKALYEDKEVERQMLISEIGRVFAKEREIKIAPILGVCQAGQNYCLICADKENCQTCDDGYFVNWNGYCSACNTNCATCQTSAENCLTCSDSTHMSAAPACACPANAVLSGTTCTSNAGYYFSTNTICSACNTNCATCTTSATNCATCSDPTHMSAAPTCACPANGALSGTTCSCNTGYYFCANTFCCACNTNCATCQVSDGNCLTCSDPTHMSAAPQCSCPTNGALLGTTCTCNAGYYFSANTVCSACNMNCATCQTSAGNCLVCSDPTHMSAAPICACPSNGALSGTTCTCNAGFYFIRNTICSACSMNCATCITSAENCVTCANTTHMSVAPACACPTNGALSGNTCTCNAGYYFSSNTVCSACNTNCAMCEVSDGNCLRCSDPTHMSAAPACACPTNGALSVTTCTCNTGYYFSANTVCSACNTNCATCTSSADNCVTCADTTHMSAAPACACPTNGALSGNTCTCNAGYYFSSNTVCSACNTNCAMCKVSDGNCLTCSDPTHMSAAPACACPTNGALSGTTCTCNTGYYFSSNTVCSACDSNCAACSGTANICLTCVDTTHMSAAPTCACPANGALSGTSCTCNAGYYFNSNTVCSACNNSCATCTISASNCITCVDPTHMSAAPACACPANASLSGSTCICNAGYYFSSNTVCSACKDSTYMYLDTVTGTCKCLDPHASFDQTSKICQCIQGYYMSSSGTCQPCIPPCAQCSSSATFCTVCDDFANMNLNVTRGTCSCKDLNFQFNPWLKTCQSNPDCNCNQCGTTINIINFNF